jgi:hypothetical protein
MMPITDVKTWRMNLRKLTLTLSHVLLPLEATVKSVEACSTEVAAASDNRLSDFEAGPMKDLMELLELYICNIWSIGGLCSPMPKSDPSAADNLRWLSIEVADLTKVFGGVNENFVSDAVDGAFIMVDDSVDLDALQDAAAVTGADIWPMGQDVQRAAHCIKEMVAFLRL